MFHLTPVTGKVSLRNILPLLRARSVLFGTIEDHYIGFIVVALLRAFLGSRTVGLFLRPQTCFKRDDTLRLTWKGWFFSVLRRIRGVSVGTIIPFAYAPHYAQIACFGVMDPHMWDKGDTSSCALDYNLANTLAHIAQGRQILAFLGAVTPIKGIDYLLDLLSQPEWPEDKLFVVVAGKVVTGLAARVQQMPSHRCLIIDRFVSDLELDTLYGCADLIWACYRPDYDQASGIFGRACQFGKMAVVRTGSQIDQITKQLSLSVIRLNFGEIGSAIKCLESGPNGGTIADNRSMLARWQDEFVQTIGALL